MMPSQTPPVALEADQTIAGESPVLAPIPFTVAQIREAFVPGLEVGWEMWTPAQTTYQHWRVLAADVDTVDLRFSSMDANAVQAPGQTQQSSWTALRQHAQFPASQTTVSAAVLDTPMGSLDTQKYVVVLADNVVRTYWFAPSLPGPPVLNTVVQAGVQTFRMQMISREVVP